ncbi:hypothetical protein [Methylobacter psychrophilus]|uniref:hypothetical protein n=1 Tax=Methylobacter psychrophilus TaxID=96941 RepID=UPI0021D4F551|nr:hypothetical protein [Methylobacter psychrophilus]
MSDFIGDLTITLVLTIAGTAHTIPAGNVKFVDLALTPYGFNGKVSFVVSCEESADALFTPMTTLNDLIEVSLQVQSYTTDTDAVISPLILSGLVTTRSFSEQTLTNILKTQTFMLHRHYHLEFADPAQVLWKQHYPCDLLTDTTLTALITAHKNEKINLLYDWPDVLNKTYPVLTLSLGAPGNPASFYDYLIWLVDTNNGVFSYDIANNQYSLSAVKSQIGTVQSLDPLEVFEYSVNFPEIHRHQPNVLNAYSESPLNTAITNAAVASPIRRDYIQRYPIAADMTARVTLETARLKQYLHEVLVSYNNFQMQVTPPGMLVDFKASSAWNASLFVYANTYQVRQWRLVARAVKQELTLDLNNSYSRYEMEHSLILDNKTELNVALPAYLLPVYPFFVEGKIVSEQGEDTDASYQFYTDSDTSVNYYQISIPLWAKKNVRAAYQSNMDTGQFYFPPYKNARVLVGLGFDNAFIANFLDWGSGTALPMDSQGNQLVMGKSTTSQNIIKHTYVDSKPELQIQRTDDKDTELLQFSTGYIILQTQLEEGS